MVLHPNHSNYGPSWISRLLVVLCAIQSLTFIEGTSPEDEEQYFLRRRRLDPRELEEGNRIFAKYTGERGHQVARNCARSILKDDPPQGEILLLGNGFCMHELMKDTQVVEANFDYELFALVEEEEEIVPEEGPDETSHATNQGGEGLWRNTKKTEVNSEFSSSGSQLIQADKTPMGPHEVKICVADTGITMGHPKLDYTNIDGTDALDKFLPGDDSNWEWDFDTNGHGTHVTGTIQHILTQNGQSGNVKIHVARALSQEGRGYEYDVRVAILHCIVSGAKIINLSLGSSYISPYQGEFLSKLIEKKSVLVIAGAGNDGDSGEVYPAAHPKVISVGAVDSSGNKIAASNSNSQVELAAPGNRIVSTDVSVSIAAIQSSNGDTYPATMIQLEGSVVSGTLLQCTDGDTSPDCSGAICFLRQQSGDILNDLLVKCMRAGGVGAILSDESNRRRSLETTQQGDELGDESPALGDVEGVLNGEGDETGTPTDAATETPTDTATEPPTYAEDEVYDPQTIPVAKLGASASLTAIEALLGQMVTIGDQYAVKHIMAERTGTSMAAPHVTAAAAILWSHHPSCGPEQIRYALAATAYHPSLKLKCSSDYGYGIIQIKDALDLLDKRDCDDWEVPRPSEGGCTTLL